MSKSPEHEVQFNPQALELGQGEVDEIFEEANDGVITDQYQVEGNGMGFNRGDNG